MDSAVQVYHRLKIKESEKRDKYFALATKTVEREGDGGTICEWHTLNGPQKLKKETGRVRNPNYNIIEIDEDSWRPKKTHY